MNRYEMENSRAGIVPKPKFTAKSKNQHPKINFSDVAAAWLQNLNNRGIELKHSTYIKYRDIYCKFLADAIGDIYVDKVDIAILEERVISSLVYTKNLSESRQKSIYCVVNHILSYASVRYHISTIPLKRNCPRKNRNKPVEIFSQTELAKLISYLYEDINIDKIGILLCLSAGLRLGEICAMRWEDIDLEQKLIYVRRTVQRISVEGCSTKTMLMETEPKSLYSKREIPLSNQMAKLLSNYSGSGAYLLNGDKPMEPRTYQNRFKRFLEESGVANRNFHTLRHTFATNCIDNGTDVKSLSEILGHSDVRITLNRYVHPTIETKRQHMDSLSAVYDRYRIRKNWPVFS